MVDTAPAPDYKSELVELDAVDKGIAALREQYGTVPDVTNKEGYALCKKGIRELTSTRTKADKLRLEITEPHRSFIEQVNNYGKEIIERIKKIEQPLKEAKQHEDERAEREKEARIAKLRERINAEILSFIDTANGLDSTGLAELHDAALAIDVDGYYDVTKEAEDAKADVLRRIGKQHGQALERERLAAEQAEVEAERRRLREEAERQESERKELEELRRFKAEQEAQKRKLEPQPTPEPEPAPAAAEHKPLDTSRLSAAADNYQRGSQVKAPDQVTISRKEYDRLLAAEAKLDALEAHGVDNWTGYSDAMEELNAA